MLKLLPRNLTTPPNNNQAGSAPEDDGGGPALDARAVEAAVAEQGRGRDERGGVAGGQGAGEGEEEAGGPLAPKSESERPARRCRTCLKKSELTRVLYPVCVQQICKMSSVLFFMCRERSIKYKYMVSHLFVD